MNSSVNNFKTHEIIKSKIESGEFDHKRSYRYYINFTSLIYQKALGKTTQKLKKEFDIKKESIKPFLTKDQLDSVYKADLFVSELLKKSFVFKDIKQLINTK